MKKSKRVVALLLAVVLCLSLTGCNYLDELRANQGFWQEDGTIQLGQYTYKMLNVANSDDFYPDLGGSIRADIYITTQDVPVLLASQFGDWFTLSEDGVFLNANGGGYYCRADKFDSIEKRLNEGFTHEVYSYAYVWWDDKGEAYVDKTYIFSQSQAEALEQALATGKVLDLPDGAYLDEDHRLEIRSCSKDLLFRRWSCDVMVSGDTYYVAPADGETVIKVPDNLKSAFEEIFWAYIDSEKRAASYYDEEYGYYFDVETETSVITGQEV